MRKLLLIIVLSLLATACTGSSADEGASGEGTDAGAVESNDSAEAVEDADAAQVFEVLAQQSHPNGTQLQVRELVFDDNATLVRVQFVNGREFDALLFLDQAETALFDASGQSYATDQADNIELAETAVVAHTFQFEAVDPAAGPFRLRVNYSEQDDGMDESSPGFEIDGIDPFASAALLPESFGIADTASHPFGLQARILGTTFTETSIGLGVELINNGGNRAAFTSGRYSSYLEDDLGNRYPLEVDPVDGYTYRIDEGDRQPGVLTFAGRIHPDATSFTGVMNSQSSMDANTTQPRLEFGPYNIDGSTPAVGGALDPIDEVVEFAHPGGADFVMEGIEFSDSGTLVDLIAENDDRNIAIRLALFGKTFLLDDLGNQYELLAPVDNEDLEIAGRAGLSAQLSFPGAIVPDATTIEVVFNDGQDSERDPLDTGFPEVRFGPFTLSRAAAELGVAPASVPMFTEMTAEALEQSEAVPLTLIFDEFDGRLVPGGVLLTLPQEILFDSGSAALRSESSDAIGKIIQVTEFYAGDPMTVIGHTDADGDDASNQLLSEQRAQAVVEALISAGAEAGLTSFEGRGELEPVGDNATEEGKQANRRVDIFFATDKGLPER